MITEAVMGVVAKVLEYLAVLLPVWSPPDLSEGLAALTTLGVFEWLRWIDYYLPVSPGLLIISALVLIGAGRWLWEWALWLASKLHLLGGGSD